MPTAACDARDGCMQNPDSGCFPPSISDSPDVDDFEEKGVSILHALKLDGFRDLVNAMLNAKVTIATQTKIPS